MNDINKMKKAELLCYASELERKLKKAEAEVERVQCRMTKAVIDGIRRDEKKRMGGARLHTCARSLFVYVRRNGDVWRDRLRPVIYAPQQDE